MTPKKTNQQVIYPYPSYTTIDKIAYSRNYDFIFTREFRLEKKCIHLNALYLNFGIKGSGYSTTIVSQNPNGVTLAPSSVKIS